MGPGSNAAANEKFPKRKRRRGTGATRRSVECGNPESKTLALPAQPSGKGHHVECTETAINALKADIQAMGESEARTTATKEVEAAQQMMAKNDMEGCKSHIHSALEATEK